MLKKVLATTALTVSTVGAVSGPAMAVGHDSQDIANANGAKTGYGNTKTGGKESPQMSLIQGTLNKPCIGLGRANIQNIVALINIGLQDIPILSSEQEQQCTDNSSINDGDDPLSHLLDDIPIISGNGSANGRLW
ncbi:RdlA protein [Streptomyces mobaraensis NBRC 13819 = DSM 40847]|uniref:RdlA protein n=1 Tax=Streptomyces mobaraensis TaxID=35621 RepID=A0A5N5WCV0_STRMB|nr:rodlin [Streptomyces mobaraensis]KAB7848590.1 RdlA protein [Streptomyces mobaraensis]QTT77839.1 RdlA protein [Streptomyces mobaraensis NBRC 13819 = DSM 40847]